MKLFNKKIVFLISSMILGATLTACSGGGQCNTNVNPTPNPTVSPSPSPDPTVEPSPVPPVPPAPDLTLQLTAPTQYPAGIPVTAYLTIFNNSEANAESLVYNVPLVTNHTGVDITINPLGAGQDCTNIKAGDYCVFTANIPAGSVPGSFTVTATPTVSFTEQIISKAGISIQAVSLKLTANIGLSDVPNSAGMFYIMPETKREAVNPDTLVTVPMTVLVKSTATAFDKIEFVDQAGNLFASVPLGSDTLNESVRTYNVTIPAGKSIQDLLIKATNNSQPICDITSGGSLPICSNTAYVYRQGTNTGFLTVEPRYATESPTYSSQVITVTNQGNARITNFVMPTLSAPLSIDNGHRNSCATLTSLESGASCSFSVKYNITNANSGYSDLVFSYNDGTKNQIATSSITYIGAINTHYVRLVFSPELGLLTTANESYMVMVTNVGNVNTDDFEFDLEDGDYYPVFVYDLSACEDDELSANGGTCPIYFSYFNTSTGGTLNLPYYYEYEIDDEYYDGSGVYPVSYTPSTTVGSTELRSVNPANGDDHPQYITTVTLRFKGVWIDESTVNGMTVKLYNSDGHDMGLTAPISESEIDSDGIPNTRINFALESELFAGEYRIVIPNLNAIKNINGTPVTLNSRFNGQINPLVTFSAQGIVDTYDFCGGESCLKIVNPNNTMATCHLLDNGGIVGCEASHSINGLTGNLSAAAIYGGLSHLKYSASEFILGTNTGTLGSLKPLDLPYVFEQATNMGVTISNPTGISAIQDNAYIVSSGKVYHCSYSTNGGLTNCQQLNMFGVSANANRVSVTNDTNEFSDPIMVISNTNSNTVTTCVSNGGSFDGVMCKNITAVDSDGEVLPFNKPFGVLAPLNQVFIANSGFAGGRGYRGAITRCTLTPDGDVTDCYYFGSELYSHPTDISMVYTNMDYYLTASNGNGSMSLCSFGDEGYWCNRFGYTNVFESSLSIMEYEYMN